MTGAQIGIALGIAGFILTAGGHTIAVTWFLRGLKSRTEILAVGLSELRADIQDLGSLVGDSIKEAAANHLETVKSLASLEGRVSNLERESADYGGTTV